MTSSCKSPIDGKTHATHNAMQAHWEIVGHLEFFIFYLSHLLTSIIGSCFLLAFYLVLVLFYYCVGNGEKLQLECQPLAKHPDQTWVSH